MPYRQTPLVEQNYYHVFNRGVEKRLMFLGKRDYQRFLQLLYYYQFAGPKPPFSKHIGLRKVDITQNPKIVEIYCYCLMPNHFHLLIKQLTDHGISTFLSQISNSYTKYFNTKYDRVGPLVQGEFKAVLIESDEQLLHLSRYIHLNPLVSNLTKNLVSYPYSSYQAYLHQISSKICSTEVISTMFKTPQEYQEFVEGYSDYAIELEQMKHLLMEEQ